MYVYVYVIIIIIIIYLAKISTNIQQYKKLTYVYF